MIWFWIMFILTGIFSWDKVTASWNGERVCVHCRKRLKFSHESGHYTEACSHCGRTQTNR